MRERGGLALSRAARDRRHRRGPLGSRGSCSPPSRPLSGGARPSTTARRWTVGSSTAAAVQAGPGRTSRRLRATAEDTARIHVAIEPPPAPIVGPRSTIGTSPVVADTKVGDSQALVPIGRHRHESRGRRLDRTWMRACPSRLARSPAAPYPGGGACPPLRAAARPTSTDARSLLGRLRPDRGLLLAATMRLDRLARGANATIADQL